jgi:transcription elongation factor GreA
LSDKPTYLTPEGKRKLQEELDHLRIVRRPEVAQRIHDAKEGGDISENAGYDEAKNEQAFIEGRIMTLEALLSRVEIINETKRAEHVAIGSRVTVMEKGCSPEAFLIVGAAESDPMNGRISNESPLGRSLMGHKPGQWVVVHTPDGPVQYEVLDIS